tara:strand:+ start:914 stop:1552 length:639 start_codon:yes stop_codon:yes gene_type:complete
MSQNKRFLKLEFLNRNKIVYRRDPISDIPTEIFNWGYYYEHGTYECYELFRSTAKINTFRSLKWHLLVLWYLNPQLSVNEFEDLANHIANKDNGFVTFKMLNKYLTNMIYDVTMTELEEPPKNKLRKVIFKDFTGLDMREKLSIVGKLIGRDKLVNEEMIYQCMLDLHDIGKKITVTGLARLLKCSPRTIYRSLTNDLKREKELLNKDNEKI